MFIHTSSMWSVSTVRMLMSVFSNASLPSTHVRSTPSFEPGVFMRAYSSTACHSFRGMRPR